MRFRQRLYEDFFKKSRLNQYKHLLILAKESGYRMMGIYDFYLYSLKNPLMDFKKEKILIMRHDIDTSPRVTRKMFDIEKEVFGFDASSTYYFRSSTMDKKLILEIDKFGYETGFHYETIANYEKKNCLKNPTKLREEFYEIKKLFVKELNDYRKKTNSLSKTVSSHGDFINRKLNIGNYELLYDQTLRKECDIAVEAYDESVNKFVNKRFADQLLLGDFSAIVTKNLGEGIILLLTHPRQWKVDFFWNLKDDVFRFFEGMKYKLRRASSK